MVELEGAADAERAADKAKAVLERLVVRLELYGGRLENEGLDTFGALRVNAMMKGGSGLGRLAPRGGSGPAR